MMNLRSLTASLLSACLVHASAGPALAQVPVKALFQKDAPVWAVLPPAQAVVESTAPHHQALLEDERPARTAPEASATLKTMGAELDASPADFQPARFYTGEKASAKSALPVLASSEGTPKAALSASTPRLPASKTAPPLPGGVKPEQNFEMLPVPVLIGIGAAIVAVGAGVWAWLRGKSKNEAWQDSKSNQDIIALEKARRDNDAETLGRIGSEARARQTRMQERVDHAKSAGDKKIVLSDGRSVSVKDAETYAAFDGLAAARAALNENAVSKDPAKRAGGERPSTWSDKLGALDGEAAKTEFEGKLALGLKALHGELGRQDEAAARFGKDIEVFDSRVPGLFGGRLKEMTQRARKDLVEFQSSEVAPEKALHAKLEGAMRGRVSGRLADKDAEYQKHLARMQELSEAAEGTLKSAVDLALQVDKDLADMASHEKSRTFNLMLASQNENVPVYDKQGRVVGYEDQSATYKALAASAGAEARASAASARAGVQALSKIVPLLHKDPLLKQEGLTFALPSSANTRVGSEGSVFFDFWMPASWNFFMSAFSESQANQARASFAPIKGGLESVLGEVNGRRQGEVRWTNGRIDRVLDEQMARAQKP